MQFDVFIFMTGCIGAVAPEIIRLYKLRTKTIKLKSSYYGVSILFFLLGGFVALILPTITLWGAFYVGVSLPSIISGYIGKSSEKIISPRTMGLPPLRPSITLREYLAILFM